MVQGLDKLKRRMEKIPKVVHQQVRYEMERIADQIVDEMYQLAPHDTGDLAGSIGWTWGEAPKGSFTVAQVRGNKSAKYGSLSLTIFAGDKEAFYARFHEFGTLKMAASPFFYVVWRLRRKWVHRRIRLAMNKGIKLAK